jgi:hypothetical protein
MTTIRVPDDPGVNLWDWLRPKLAAAVAQAITDGGGQDEGRPADDDST